MYLVNLPFTTGDKSKNLNWKQRFGIIYGTARGLAYLHEQYHVTIIHRDIKTSNILLDHEFEPKIADFGLIRLLPEDKTHISTKMAGSGYVKLHSTTYKVVIDLVLIKRHHASTPKSVNHHICHYHTGSMISCKLYDRAEIYHTCAKPYQWSINCFFPYHTSCMTC